MNNSHSLGRRAFLWRTTAALAGLGSASLIKVSAVPGVDGSIKNPFFAMDTGTRDEQHQTPESQARMLKELGFAGIGWGPNQVPEMQAALDELGLRMFTVYIGVEVDGVNRTAPAGILKLIDQLKGRETALWLPVTSKKYSKPSDETGDEDALALLGDIADHAQRANLKVSLYPHTGSWLERVQDAVRLARKLHRQNLGVTFNLCHCLRVGDEPRIPELLELARPHLFLVTINGADHTGDWDRLIQPLGQGTFDVGLVLRTLKRLDYQGPIGLQHYGIKGDARRNLQQSMAGWRKLCTQIQ
jgi:sugar phosphate isomerase/epimerase